MPNDTASVTALPRAWIPTDNGEDYPALDVHPAAYANTYYEPGEPPLTLPIYKPSWSEFQNFYQFVKSIERVGLAHSVVKVIPPPEWLEQLPDLGDKLDAMQIEEPVWQTWVKGGPEVGESYVQEVERKENKENKKMWDVRTWAKMCHSKTYRPPAAASIVDRLRYQGIYFPRSRAPSGKSDALSEPNWDYRNDWLKGYRDASKVAPSADLFEQDDLCTAVSADYWTRLKKDARRGGKGGTGTKTGVWYGADQDETFFPEDLDVWNLGRLDNVLTRMTGQIRRDGQFSGDPDTFLPGITSPYVYFGSYRSSFGWHTEDYDMHSINYLHFGAPKIWYAIVEEDRERFEESWRTCWPQEAKECPEFMRHKHFLGDPASSTVRKRRIVQRAGEFIITFPRGYHSGFNMGFNCAEAANFATEAWTPYGLQANICKCATGLDEAAQINLHARLKRALEEERKQASMRIAEKECHIEAAAHDSQMRMEEEIAALKAEVASLRASLQDTCALLEQAIRKDDAINARSEIQPPGWKRKLDPDATALQQWFVPGKADQSKLAEYDEPVVEDDRCVWPSLPPSKRPKEHQKKKQDQMDKLTPQQQMEKMHSDREKWFVKKTRTDRNRFNKAIDEFKKAKDQPSGPCQTPS